MNCPHCNKKNRPGLLLCEYCGHQLITLSDLSRYKTLRFNTADLIAEPDEDATPKAQPGTSRLYKASFVTLELLETNTKLYLSTHGHLSLGRADKDSAWQPSVDLTPYGAAEKGVSRMHADLFFEDDQVFVLELGSANGTRVNGQTAYMGLAKQIRDGDVLELGRLKIKVHFC